MIILLGSKELVIVFFFNPFMPSRLYYLSSLDDSISMIRDVWVVIFLSACFIDIPVLNANSVDPDQTPHCAASDLGIHCLPISNLWDVRLKWVNMFAVCIGLFGFPLGIIGTQSCITMTLPGHILYFFINYTNYSLVV